MGKSRSLGANLPENTITSAQLYTAIEELLKARGRMSINSIIKWAMEEKGYNFAQYGYTPRTSLVQRMRGIIHGRSNPTLVLGPVPQEGERGS